MMHLHHTLHAWHWPVIAAAIVLEAACYLIIGRRSYPWREMWASVGVYLLRIPATFLRPLAVLPLALLVWSHRLASVPLNSAWAWVAAFIGVELAYYWMHRLSHEVRWLWASHVVHHTPEHIHLASAFRLGATELLSGNWVFYMPLYWLGLNPLAVAAMQALNLSYQFWLHTDLIGTLGPLEWIFNTPAHHRVHHATNDEYLDRNYGGVLIVWDRLFGTFAAERRDTPIVYGLVHPIGSLNPLVIVFHEWAAMARDCKRACSWPARLTQVFGRPADSLAALSVRQMAAPMAAGGDQW